MWKNTEVPDRPQMTVRRMRIARWIPEATHTHTHALTICNTYCISTTILVARTLLIVTLHVHCLSCCPSTDLSFYGLVLTPTPLNMVTSVLTAVRWTKTHGPRLTTDWDSGEYCPSCRLTKRGLWDNVRVISNSLPPFSFLFLSFLSFLFFSFLFFSFLFFSFLFFSYLIFSILFFSYLFFSYLIFSFLIFSFLFLSFLFYSFLFLSFLFYSFLIFSYLFFSFLFFSFLLFLSSLFRSVSLCSVPTSVFTLLYATVSCLWPLPSYTS